MKEIEKKEIIDSLRSSQATLPVKLLYDNLGGKLFDAITETEEYTPTKDELSVFSENLEKIKAILPNSICLIDLGAGSCFKAEKVLPVLNPACYLAVDLPSEFFMNSVQRLSSIFPEKNILSLEIDFTEGLTNDLIDTSISKAGTNLAKTIFFPGSTIGNFSPVAASKFLSSFGNDFLIIGIDLLKTSIELEKAYDDALGVTAAFNKNILLNLNRQVGTNFDVTRWSHKAIFNSEKSRIEMHLVAKEEQIIESPYGEISFSAQKSIHTENSYKYTVESFSKLLSDVGYIDIFKFVHPNNRYAVFLAKRNKQF